MSDAAPGNLPGHIQLTDFDLSLRRDDARAPLRPMVQGLRLRISEEGLRELAQGLVEEADRRAPVGLRLNDVRVGPDGVDLSLRLQKSILRGDLATRLELSAPGGQVLRAELTETDMPAWVPLDLLLDEAVKRGRGAIERDPGNRRALLLDPAALLARAGLPARFAPGMWGVATTGSGVELGFRERTAAG
jgi:hypothetical protein